MNKTNDKNTRRRTNLRQERPTIHSANLLFLISMVLLLVVGTPAQKWSPHWGSIIIAAFFPLLALLFLRYHKLPPRVTLRLRWPGRRLAALSLLIGVGVWLMATWLGNLVDMLFGYSVPWSPDFFPTTPAEAVPLFLAWCIAAPLGEEVLFRGLIQRAHERRGPRIGILGVALLFALYHMSFQSLLALLPIALALGYVVWRSDSLLSGILVHFANNVLASGRIVTASLRPDLELGIPSLPAAMVGAILTLVGLWLFRRDTAPPPPPAFPEPTSWLRRTWPLVIAVLIFVVLAGLQFVAGRFPEALALDRLELQEAPWEGPTQWRYELRTDAFYPPDAFHPHILDEPVGHAECRLTPEPEDGAFALDCQVQQAAFEARKGRRYFNMDEMDLHQMIRWQRDGLHLVEGEAIQQSGERRLALTLTPDEEGLVLSVSQDDGPPEELTLPDDVLLAAEWPWRLSALPFRLSYSRKATLVWPSRWREETQSSGLVAEDTYVVVRGAEPVWTPAGSFVAWRVTVGDHQTAWYDAEAPHTLVRYHDGIVTYLLTEVEQESSTSE